MTASRPIRKADLKIVMIGDSSIGKTCLVLRYIDRQFQNSISTIGASFILKPWGHYNIAIWDTAGGERYTGMSTFYYRNASAAILSFDLTNRKTFESLSEKYLPILNTVNSAKLKVIVGTKSDLLKVQPREVTAAEGKELAKTLNPQLDSKDSFIPYFETSSKNGANVDNMFEYVFENFYPNAGSEPRPVQNENNISLSSNHAVSTKSSFLCC